VTVTVTGDCDWAWELGLSVVLCSSLGEEEEGEEVAQHVGPAGAAHDVEEAPANGLRTAHHVYTTRTAPVTARVQHMYST